MKEKSNKQKNLERLKRLRPIDDTFMRCMFKDNIELAQLVLRIIIGKEDLVITKIETQADMKRVTGARSLCLDAYGADSVGKKYDVEMQKESEGADPHRARYHSSVIDIENLDAGQDFSELPDTYVIFITEKDYFKDGLPIHKIQRIDESTGKAFGDGTHIIYVNGEYRGDSDIGRLMEDFNNTDPDTMHFKQMADKARYLKENPKGVETMCNLMEEMVNEGKAELIERYMKLNNCNVDDASRAFALTESEKLSIGQYLKAMTQDK